MKKIQKRLFPAFVVALLSIQSCSFAATRWSSLHILPDADLLDNNNFVTDVNTTYISDSAEGAKFCPSLLVTYSLTRWANFEIGYADKVTLGLKARILGDETKTFMPSLAFGIRACVSNREIYLYGNENNNEDFTNELYLALGKSIEPIRLRIHAGILSIHENNRESFNPYAALEKYFGGGVYLTAEMQRRNHEFVPSVFASWRLWEKRIEVSFGVVALSKMLFDNNHKFDAGITTSTDDGFVHPSFYLGLRFHGNLGRIGAIEGIKPVENKVDDHERYISLMKDEIDSMNKVIDKNRKKLDEIEENIALFSDSTKNRYKNYRIIVLEKLGTLNALYSQEPFDPELVKKGFEEIVGYRNEIVGTLSRLTSDSDIDKKVRRLAVTALGMIGTEKALDALIEVLGQSRDPDLKIEALIGLGKNKDTRALYLVKKFTSDPNDAISFTAKEVCKKLDSQEAQNAPADNKVDKAPVVIPETKIGTQKPSGNSDN